MKRMVLGFIVLMIIVLGACSDKKEAGTANETNAEVPSSKQEAETSKPDESETPEGFARFDMEMDGEMVILEQSIASPKQLPIDFTLPIPKEENIVTGSDRYFWPNGEITFHVVFEAPMEFDDLVDFYEEALNDMDLTVSRETYEPTSLAIISAEAISVKVEDVYEPDSFEVTIITEKE